DLRTESPGRKKLPEGSKGGAGSTPSKTKKNKFDKNNVKALTRVFTRWMETAENVKDKKEIFEVYEKDISIARYIQKIFDRLRQNAASENDDPFTYHKALNQRVEDSEALRTSLASAKESLESKRRLSDLLNRNKSKREKALKGKEILDLEKRIDVVGDMKRLKGNFDYLLESLKVLDLESYKNLEKLKDNPEISADDGNEILDDLVKNLEVKKKEYDPTNFTPKILKYDDFTKEELAEYFPLLYICKYHDLRKMTRLLSVIKRTLMNNKNPVNEGNTDPSSRVAVDDTLFYDVIIPHFLLAYVHDEGIDKAKEFVELTRKETYNLYNVDGHREHWPGRYFEYLDHIEKYKTSEVPDEQRGPHTHGHDHLGMTKSEKTPPIPYYQKIIDLQDVYPIIHKLEYDETRDKLELTLALAPSDYAKHSKLVDELRSKAEK
ncbi:hypothetical protein IWQ62_006320, partial [Dispira parvispora]